MIWIVSDWPNAAIVVVFLVLMYALIVRAFP